MDTDLVAPATPTETPVDAPPEAPVDLSIADHEAQFGKGTDKTPVPVEEKPRHRAKSQQAAPADVPRIAELTKRLREAERERDEWKSKHAPAASPTPIPERMQPVVIPPVASTDKPTWKAFEEQIGTKYESWGDAQDAYIDARDDWKATSAQREAASKQEKDAEQAEAQRWTDTVTAHQGRLQAFVKTHPDFVTTTQEVMNRNLPPALRVAIVRSENSPDLIYTLAQHPDELDELHLYAEGKTVSDDFVALLQRRLQKLSGQAAPTGSVAGVAHIPPRPPNPVRTGPLKPSDELPGDDASIAEHARVWGKRRR